MSSDIYFQRFGFCDRQIAMPPRLDLGMIVVIPAFDEPDLTGSLESLWACTRPACAVEIIVVINGAVNCSAEVRHRNRSTLDQAILWDAIHADSRLVFHFLHFSDLPAKQAGVGLARKIGMDEAARRFDEIGRPDGVVVCYDADCRCDRDYLCSIERHFREHPRSPGCSIYFEHPLAGPLEPKVYEAIAAYELHLRYYVQALRFAGFPHAFHTIGSSMAVRAGVYKQQGGMNKRQAGEDFYFLHKIIPLGDFTDLTTTRVLPSPRVSHRVPFGTGKAVGAYLNGIQSRTYPLEAFLDLKVFLEQRPARLPPKEAVGGEPSGQLPESVRTFLLGQGFDQALEEIRQNTSNEAAFQNRFFRWLNGFQAMKFVHHARDHYYGEREIPEEARRLLALVRPDAQPETGSSLLELLKQFRELDRFHGQRSS
jgi:hypothetical protein